MHLLKVIEENKNLKKIETNRNIIDSFIGFEYKVDHIDKFVGFKKISDQTDLIGMYFNIGDREYIFPIVKISYRKPNSISSIYLSSPIVINNEYIEYSKDAAIFDSLKNHALSSLVIYDDPYKNNISRDDYKKINDKIEKYLEVVYRNTAESVFGNIDTLGNSLTGDKKEIANYMSEWKEEIKFKMDKENEKNALRASIVDMRKRLTNSRSRDEDLGISRKDEFGLPESMKLEDFAVRLVGGNDGYWLNSFLDSIHFYPESIYLCLLLKRGYDEFIRYLKICNAIKRIDRLFLDNNTSDGLEIKDNNNKKIKVCRMEHSSSYIYINNVNRDITYFNPEYFYGFINTGAIASYRRTCAITPMTVMIEMILDSEIVGDAYENLKKHILYVSPRYFERSMLGRNILFDRVKVYNDEGAYFAHILKGRNEVIIDRGMQYKYISSRYEHIDYVKFQYRRL